MPHRPLLLGTRRSPLAMAQAKEARDRLLAAHPALAIELVPVTASGDKVQDRPLAEIGGKALWTKELDAQLLAGEIDFAVHSLKDVETHRPAAIVIAAILPREDVRDVLVGVADLADLPRGARIGTSAPRRAALARHMRPDFRIVPLRGNVATRLAKLEAGEVDATLLAAAGLNRLGLGSVGTPLDPMFWPPAPGQGAIAIECRAALRLTQGDRDAEIRALLAAIDHRPSRDAVFAERALLAALGGGCHSPIAVFTSPSGGDLFMRAAIYSPDGAERVLGEALFAAGDPSGPAELAARLLSKASAAVRQHFSGPAR